MKIVCIGNSIVNGFPLRRSQCFAGLLHSRYGYEIINRGINGDTTDGIYRRFDSDVISHRPDVCLLLTGTNDFIGGKSAEQAFDNITKITAKAAQLETMRMALLTPLLTYPEMAERMWIPADYQVLNRTLEEFAGRLKTIEGCSVIDTQNAFRNSGIKTEDAYSDGIHPTAAAHEFLAKYIAEQLDVLLK
jgi:acyl-CoA thioesterase I